MSKKRFYDNKNRNKKWTEKPVGHKIYFAEKYIDENQGENKYNKKRRSRKPIFTKENGERLLRGLIVAVVSVAIISVGYIIMDVHIDRHAMPLEDNAQSSAGINDVQISVKGTTCQPLSLDGSIMLSAVIDTAFDGGYTSLAFELKRNDGTVGYESRLATIDAYGAVSSPSGNLEGSVKVLTENDILPVGIISCYKDNIVPTADLSAAALEGGSLYKDSAGNTYLNPNADSTYSYIKSIVDEAAGMGITVFLLDSYNLPDDISANYDDGFDYLAGRLYDDFGSDIKLLKAVDLNLSSGNAKSLEQEWKEKTDNIDDDKNAVFYITAKDPSMVKQFLDNRGITNYIISE